ncbi:glycoside hydrolase family 43 protein [Plenodomus tracheiphilus IPT5]|uniref:Arabinan endo-1,5-alpha-L-arabinosidase n=1 Tax=Plenodomus tracheiphilus IPT5 TaxID=1408161 RepID=A0A6A7B3A8_9PLEO|nr:glycoside hydrolase family 43 protein [Plenodomus tracheiphilus IPT5]
MAINIDVIIDGSSLALQNAVENMMRLSKIVRFTASMSSAIMITCATFLPFLFQVVEANPLPQALSSPLFDGYYPNPEPCRGNCTWVLDPSILYDDGVYWRFSTSGNIAIATASKMEGPWEYRGALLTNGTKIFVNYEQDIWAPSVTKIGDTFYCHYAVSSLGTKTSTIGVATSKSLEPGTWRDHGSINLPLSPDYNLIDPYIYQETPNSPIYLSFGSFWKGIYQTKLTDKDQLLTWTGDYESLHNIISNTTTKAAVIEGAVLHTHEKNYYMFFSVGWCCNTLATGLAQIQDVYHIVVCRAKAITGPFYDKAGSNCLTENGGTTILASHGDVYAPGGQDITVHPESGRTMMSYHYIRPSVSYDNEKKFFGFNYLEWQDGWPVVV